MTMSMCIGVVGLIGLVGLNLRLGAGSTGGGPLRGHAGMRIFISAVALELGLLIGGPAPVQSFVWYLAGPLVFGGAALLAFSLLIAPAELREAAKWDELYDIAFAALQSVRERAEGQNADPSSGGGGGGC